MNYTDLKVFIQNWNEDDSGELNNELDNIIQRAEHRIFRDIPKHPSHKTSIVGNLQNGASTVSVNSSIRVVRSFRIIVNAELLNVEQRNDDFITELYPNSAVRGVPKFFALENFTNFLFGPTPDANYAYSIKALTKPESIITANRTWIGDNFEDVLQNACMVETKMFLEHPEELKVWTSTYQNSLRTASQEVAAMHATEFGAGV